jgi:putative ABC transport system permease protein
VRVALGATRWRITRQLLIESIVLGLVSGVIGLLLAVVGVRLFDIAVQGVGKPFWIKFTMDYVVFGYLAAVCVVTGILFGIVPALQVSRTNVNDIIKEGGRGSAGNRRAFWMSGTMVVVELALTIVLLVGAGLMIRSFLKLYSLDLGIRTENLMTMRLGLSDPKYRTPEARRAFFERLAPRLASIPGADAVSVTTSVPPNGGARRDVDIDGRPPLKEGEKAPEVVTVTISPSFFDTVGMTVRRGRAFTDQDGAPGYETVIVNERLAAQLFPNEDPVGKRIKFRASDNPPPNTPPQVWRTIVGISGTMRHNPPQEAAPASVVYVPYRQEPPGGAVLLVRSRLDPSAVMAAVRREVQAIDQDQPVSSVQTMDQLLAQTQWPFRVFGTLFAILAFIGLTLSAVGLYAVMAYSVTQRTQEIGVRMALGAAARQVSWLVLRRGLVQLGIGLLIGVGGAYWLTSVMKSQISEIVVQITPNDPGTFVAITLLLLGVGIAACLIPARRATRVDPMVAFRAE